MVIRVEKVTIDETPVAYVIYAETIQEGIPCRSSHIIYKDELDE